MFLVFDIPTIFLCLAILGMIHDHNQGTTKPNQAKSSLYRPFLGVFDPFLGQNTQKPTMIDLKEHSFWKYTYVSSIFHWSHFWANLFLLDTLLTTCAVVSIRKPANISLSCNCQRKGGCWWIQNYGYTLLYWYLNSTV